MDVSDRKAALVLFSAGQDSSVCLAWALARYTRVESIGFDYGQAHAVELAQRPLLREAIAALRPEWRARLGPDRLVDMRAFASLAPSTLTGAAPSPNAPAGLPATFVPGRNLAFLAYAGAHASVRGLGALVGGMCETDFAGYPDCRREAIDAMEAALRLGLDPRLSIETPLMRLTKAQTWALAEELGGAPLVETILELSHTCYRGVRALRHAWGYGCGECAACQLRAAGYAEWRGGS